MAVVTVGEKRVGRGHFGFYRTSAGGDESIVVRRKIGEPVDYMHSDSKEVQDQRRRLTLASQRYAKLTPRQKRDSRLEMRFVSRVKNSLSETVLLQGRQLFISEAIREQKTGWKMRRTAFYPCIILCDEEHTPLEGVLHLWYTKGDPLTPKPGKELCKGNWLFERVPAYAEPYKVWGEADGYYDPELPENMVMTEDYLRHKHYHVLYPLKGIILTAFPEPYTEKGTLDAQFYKFGPKAWTTMRGNAGSVPGKGDAESKVGLETASAANMYAAFYRSWMLFDTSLLPDECTIVSAKLIVRCLAKDVTPNFDGGWGVSGCYPVSNTNLLYTDWSKIYTENLAHIKYPDEIVVGEDIEFQFNEAGLAYIVKEGITKLTVREGVHDIPNVEPTWAYPWRGFITLGQADRENIAERPRLEVLYE